MKKVPAATSSTRKSYDSIVASLEARGAASGAMFGMPALKIAGKTFAGLFGNALVFNLGGAAHEGALALKGAVLFDPSGMGRPMKDWIVVPSSHERRWLDLAHLALENVASAAMMAPKKKGAAKKKAATAK